MPPSPRAAALTEAHRIAQVRLSAQTQALSNTAWRLLDPLRVDETSERWLRLMEPIVRRQRHLSAGLAGDYYQRLRMLELDASGVNAVLATTIADEEIEGSLARTVIDRLDNPPAGQPWETTVRNARNGAGRSAARMALNGGRQTVLDTVQADRLSLGWTRIGRGEPCAFCRLAVSRGPVYRSQESADFHAHDGCVLGTTAVRGPRFEAGFRRWYEGELVIISAADGSELSITPKHPVLTRRGWVDAGDLRESDDLVRRDSIDRGSLGVPHKDDVPSLIEDVWRTHSVDWLCSVPVAAEHFHGDGVGTKGNVDVVSSDGLFSRVFDAALVESATQEIRAAASSSAVLDGLASGGDLDTLSLGGHSPPCCGVCSDKLLASAFGRQGGLVQLVGGGDTAVADPGLFDPASHGGARDSDPFGNRLHGFTGRVGVDNPLRHSGPVGRPVVGRAPRFDPPPLEGQAERLRIHAELGGNLLERLTGLVQLDRPTDLRRIDYSGHVFNLQTVEGWYSANSVVVSNCHCTAAPAFLEDDLWTEQAEQQSDIYYAALDEAREAGEYSRGTSNDSLNALRRYLSANA